MTESGEQSVRDENLKPVTIEPASPDQAPSLIEIQRKCYLSSYVHTEYGITEADILAKNASLKDETVRRLIGEPFEVWLVAKRGEEVVGFVEAKKIHGDKAQRISRLFVLPEQQGKRIGQRLMQQALSQLDPNEKVILQVNQYNGSVIRFYEQFGFRDIGEGKPIKISEDKTIPTRKMVLDRHLNVPL
jgi:ribosomal protein S18 acetylase RimI-like enzyme